MRQQLRFWRKRVAETARQMAGRGLVCGSSGNVSARIGDLVLITPTSIPYEYLDPRQVMAIKLDGRAHSGSGMPSSEWRMHVAIYQTRPDVRAVVHTHSIHATAAAVALSALPVVNDEGKILFGNRIPISQPAPPGTTDLAKAAVQALEKSELFASSMGKAVLLANHGVVTVGRTLREAFLLAVKVEEMAELFWLSQALSTKEGLAKPPPACAWPYADRRLGDE